MKRAAIAAVVIALVAGSKDPASYVLARAEAPAYVEQGRGGLTAPVGPRQPSGLVLENPPTSFEVFVCGNDHRLPNPIPLREATLILAGDARLYVPCPTFPAVHTHEDRESREVDVLWRGLRSIVPIERWRAAQAVARLPRLFRHQFTRVSGKGPDGVVFGAGLEDNLGDLVTIPAVTPACSVETQRFGPPTATLRWQPGHLFQLLLDPSPDVQKEAAYAIGTRLSSAGRGDDLYTAAFNEIRACLLRSNAQMTDEVRGLLFEAIGVAAYATDAQRDAAEVFLIQQARGSTERLLGVTRGLEALVRQNVRRPLQPDSRTRLRELAAEGQIGQPLVNDPKTTIRILAVQALTATGDTDIQMLRRAAADADWQVRRLIAGRLNLSDADHAALADQFAVDPAFQVRYDLLASLSRFGTVNKSCAPVGRFLKDEAPLVAMRAMDVLSANCTDLDKLIPVLEESAERLDRATEIPGVSSWHVPARALTAIARLKPELAKARLDSAAKNGIWQVRAAAAGVAAALQDEAVAHELAKDQHHNVQTAALDALFRMKSPAVVPSAIAALQSGKDFQLLMTAARVLRGLPADSKNDATEALLAVVRRLTDERRDMSRDPRVAILERLSETMAPERSTDLLRFTTDFDDAVVAAARKAFMAVVGAAAHETAMSRRYPFQPREPELRSLPTTATITLDDGIVELRLLPDVAPVTIARFVQIATSGAYNDKTFHRIVPNFVVQGGSAGGNEYSGVTPRFMRDEVGPQARHIRGAVGISTRGVDTGDGQIFIDLVDIPRLDRHYTVFAYVTSGMEFVDRMLEGAKIKIVTVK